eukprot:TRINITY_DN8963_c0_g2_i4.p1 TRINITY_DN8963_c0_g2~~TRINITY_DN8963_c0_g2_i4.p1  ORF type:complete len:2566 (-),score=598.63 TRINITY_DN8963_c0_g2_i4:108-7325(-)
MMAAAKQETAPAACPEYIEGEHTYELRFTSDEALASPFCQFPADDVSVETQQRPARCDDPPLITPESDLQPWVKQSLGVLFTDPWKVVEHHYQDIPQVEGAQVTAPDATRSIEGIHVEWLKQLSDDSLNAVDEKIRGERAKDHASLMAHYMPTMCTAQAASTMGQQAPQNKIPPLGGLTPGHKLLLEVKHVELSAEEGPLHFCIAVYNVTKNLKISENFYFDTITAEDTQANPKAIIAFPPAYQQDNLWILIRADKESKALRATGSRTNANLFFQNACWTACELSDGGTLLDNKEGYQFYKVSLEDVQSVVEFTSDIKKQKKIEKTVTAKWKLSVRPWQDTKASQFDIYDAMARKASIHGSESNSSLSSGSLTISDTACGRVQQLQHFCPEPHLCIGTAPVFNLYLYPEVLNFGKDKKFSVCTYVYLRDSDTPFSRKHEHCIPMWYSHQQDEGDGLLAFQTTLMSPESRASSFQEELKVRLPVPIPPKLHLLFLFHSVSLKENKQQNKSWFSVLPLTQADGRLIEFQQDTYHLPVAIGYLPNGYLVARGHKYVKQEQQKGAFQFHLQLACNTFPYHQPLLRSFLEGPLQPDTAVLSALLEHLPVMTADSANFFPLLATRLLQLVCGKDASCRHLATKVLLTVIALVTQVSPAVVTHYVTYTFDLQDDPNLFITLTDAFFRAIGETEKRDSPLCDDFLFFSAQAMFDLITKSLTLRLAEDGHLNSRNRVAWLKEDGAYTRFLRLLNGDLAPAFSKRVSASLQKTDSSRSVCEANAGFAHFLCDLASVFHRGCPVDMAKVYLQNLSELASGQFSDKAFFLEFDFLHVLTNYEHFVAWNLPVVSADEENVVDMADYLIDQHPLIGMVVRTTQKVLHSKTHIVRRFAFHVTGKLLKQIETDVRYQSPSAKEAIAHMFLPFMLMVTNDWHTMETWYADAGTTERQALLVILLHILKNVCRESLAQWWSREVLSALTIFLSFITKCVACFQLSESSGEQLNPLQELEICRARLLSALFLVPALPSIAAEEKATKIALKRKSKYLVPGRILSPAQRSRLSISPTSSPLSDDSASTASPVISRTTSFIIADKVGSHNKALWQEANLICLDVLEQFVAHFRNEMQHRDYLLMDKVTSTLLSFFQNRQSPLFYYHLFASLRSFTFRFRRHLFRIESTFPGDLCTNLVSLCNCEDATTRSLATSHLYVLAKQNFKELGSVEKLNNQVINALSALSFQETHYFESSLSTLYERVTQDHAAQKAVLSTSTSVVATPDAPQEDTATPTVDTQAESLTTECLQESVTTSFEYKLQMLEDWRAAQKALMDTLSASATFAYPITVRKAAVDAIVQINMTRVKPRMDELADIATHTSDPQAATSRVTRLTVAWNKLLQASSALKETVEGSSHKQARQAKFSKLFAQQAQCLMQDMFATLVSICMSSSYYTALDTSESLETKLARLHGKETNFREKTQEQLNLVNATLAKLSHYPTSSLSKYTSITLQDVEVMKTRVERAFSLLQQTLSSEKGTLTDKHQKISAFVDASVQFDTYVRGHLKQIKKDPSLESQAEGVKQVVGYGESTQRELSVMYADLRQILPPSCRQWLRFQPILNLVAEAIAHHSGLQRRNALLKKDTTTQEDLEQQEAAFVADIMTVTGVLNLVAHSLGTPKAVVTEEQLTKTRNESQALSAELSNHVSVQETLLQRSEQLTAVLKRKPFCPVSVSAVQGNWQTVTNQLTQYTRQLDDVASKHKQYDEWRREYGNKLNDISTQLDNLIVKIVRERSRHHTLGENLSDSLESFTSDMQVLHACRNRLVESKVPYFAKYAFASAEELEIKASAVQNSLVTDEGTPKQELTFAGAVKRHKFAHAMQEMCTHINKIIRDISKLQNLKVRNEDPLTVQQLLFDLAQSYATNPDLHVNWVLRLSKNHEENQNFSEAAVCKLHCCLVMFNCLKLSAPLDTSKLAAISSHFTAHDYSQRDASSTQFTEKLFLETLHSAITLFYKAELFEMCAVLYTFVSPLFQHKHMLRDLADTHLQLHDMYQQIAEKDTARIVDQFWRVAFYGKRLGELNGTEYIFKEHVTENLFTLKERFMKMIGGKVSMLDATRAISAEELEKDPEMCYLQVTSAKPYWDETESKLKTYFLDKLLPAGRFVIEVPFTSSGKAHAEEASQQWKRKVVFSVACSFPWLLKRQKVTSRTEIHLSPIENSIETMERRVADLREEVQRLTQYADAAAAADGIESPPSPAAAAAAAGVKLTALQGLLQGSVRLQVNGGVAEILQSFPPSSESVQKHKTALCNVLQEFLFICRKALVVDSRLVKQDQRAFHHELESGFAELEKKVVGYLTAIKFPQQPMVTPISPLPVRNALTPSPPLPPPLVTAPSSNTAGAPTLKRAMSRDRARTVDVQSARRARLKQTTLL